MIKAYLQKKFVNILIRHLFNTVTADDILQQTVHGMKFRGQLLSKEDAEAIKKGAAAFQDSIIWKVLLKEMQYAANQRMFEKSTSENDILFGKAMLYTIDILDRKIINLSNLK